MKLLIIGHARHGKDTVADHIAEYLDLKTISSSMAAINHWLYEKYKDEYGFTSELDMYERRGEMRKTMFDEIVEFNTPNLSSLAEVIFENNDIYVGCRNHLEVIDMQIKNMVDLTIYVDASERLPLESSESCTITKDLADIIIDNNDTLEMLINRLNNFCYLLKHGK